MAENEQNQSGDVAGGVAAAVVAKPSATDRVQRALEGGAVDKPGEKKPEVKPPVVETPGEKKPADAPDGFVSKADAQRMIDDGIKAAMDASRGERAQADVRQQFIIKNLGDLPMFAQDLIPKTGDVKELAKAEQDVRTELGKWVKKMINEGRVLQAEDGTLRHRTVGGASREGGQTANLTEMRVGKQTPTERVHNALNKTG